MMRILNSESRMDNIEFETFAKIDKVPKLIQIEKKSILDI